MPIGNFKSLSRKGLAEEANPKPTRYYSGKQEKQVAKAIGGQQTISSGSTMFSKGDVTNDLFLFECKTKVKDSDSITVKKDWIIKNKEEAAFMGKEHQAVVINFGPNQPNYYIIEEYLFTQLLEFLRDEKN